jgi:bifunctional oligoribonuclease and PAP phosphatase NrnA
MPASLKGFLARNTPLAAFCQALRKYDDYLLSCHISPEGDAIGSILAMDSLLRRLGKRTTVVGHDPFPSRLFCLSSRRWHEAAAIRKPAGSYKALLVADCPNLDRIGTVNRLLTPETVVFNIDHHISNTFFGKYNYVRPEAAASGEVVFEIFKKMKMKLTHDEAANLYVALSTDTGSFKYGNTTVRSHQMAAELIKVGIDLETINDELYATYSLNKINLYSRLLARVKTVSDGQIAWVTMEQRDLQDSGATDEDAEGFIDFLKYLREVKAAFFLIELPPKNVFRVSFRSKGALDVNKIAMRFLGGGHKKAAGCIIHATRQEAERRVLAELKKVFPSR